MKCIKWKTYVEIKVYTDLLTLFESGAHCLKNGRGDLTLIVEKLQSPIPSDFWPEENGNAFVIEKNINIFDNTI